MGINKININNNDSNYAHSIFDISEYTGKSYDTLSDALSDVPNGKQKGGMTVSFVSTSDNSDNKYVQYRLMSDTFNTNVSNWQGIDELENNTRGILSITKDCYSNDDSITVNSTSGQMLQQAGASAGDIFDASSYEYANSVWVSDLIPISPSAFYNIIASSWFAFGLYAIYDANQNYITGEFANQGAEGTVINKQILTPVNAAYIRIASYSVKNAALSAIIKEEVVACESYFKYKGKKWAALGDSLTEVNSRTSLHYHDYVTQKTGISVINLGSSGTGYAKTKESGRAFFQRVTSIPIDSDVVTIFGSFNDLSSGLSLGEITDNDDTTICGCMNLTLDNLFQHMPVVNLGVVTPTPWVGAYPGVTSSDNYVQAIIDICKKRSIPCLDLYHCSNLRPWDATFRDLAYSHDDGNGVHPDETGHLLIAARFEHFIESLLI